MESVDSLTGLRCNPQAGVAVGNGVYDDLIDRIYGAVAEPESWSSVLGELCQAFNAHSGVLVNADNRKPGRALAIMHGVFEDMRVREDYMSYYGTIDPAVPLVHNSPIGQTVVMSTIWSPAEMARDEFFNDFFSKTGLRDSLGVNLLKDERGSALFAIQRNAGSFLADDASRFRLIIPHLRRAVQLHRQMEAQRRTSDSLTEVIDRLAVGVVMLDEEGRVWHLNRTAQAMLDRRDGLAISRERVLSAVNRDAASRLDELVRAVLWKEGRHAGGQLHVPRRDPQQFYGVLVTPLPLRRGSMAGTDPARGALLLIHDPQQAHGHDLSVFSTQYQLTRAEAALLAALLAGLSLKEHCEARKVSINTGKFHLRSMFMKTGARGQADLIRIALSALGAIS